MTNTEISRLQVDVLVTNTATDWISRLGVDSLMTMVANDRISRLQVDVLVKNDNAISGEWVLG